MTGAPPGPARPKPPTLSCASALTVAPFMACCASGANTGSAKATRSSLPALARFG